MNSIGQVLHSFFEDHLKTQRGLRPSSICSYRDTIKLFLLFVTKSCHRPVTRLALTDLSSERVLEFLRAMEAERGNQVRTRNQRLAALHTFYRYLALYHTEMLAEAERVEAIPSKRSPPPETVYLERDEIDLLFKSLSIQGPLALRDRALLMLLYNTGARVQEIADLRVGDVDLDGPFRVRLHGKGDKWRVCPVWPEAATLLKQLASVRCGDSSLPLFESHQQGHALTRSGVYKIVKRHTRTLRPAPPRKQRGISPHSFRHSAAVSMLEAGVDINVIRSWLGHVSLDTTNRYAEISLRAKQAAVAACSPPSETTAVRLGNVGWRQDQELLKWLQSL
ncbi:tyrosine-type recombinase/integrase [Caballeronia telluris]|jgi:site-specific recombinase XerD|uniref:Integrase domain-containing protein n=1 Tax=Caballeronia telluris TaxID=326475 RepID=A0A158KKQ2_9BURK|nr:tyrosine-type recombinase/integrase [Caballeronia telluris]SAL80981.1 integrase domain-containing protein [Caballeronia telluris]